MVCSSCGLSGHIRTNKHCLNYVRGNETASSSSQASSTSNLPSARASALASSSRSSSGNADNSGDDNDGGEEDDPELEELEAVDGELLEEDLSIVPRELQNPQWILQEVERPPAPNTSNRSGEVARQESTMPRHLLPRGRTPGVKNIPADMSKTPYDYWRLLWNPDLIDQFRWSTNDYAEAQGEPIPEITSVEMICYFGAVMFMGMVKVPSRRQYFSHKSNKFSTPFVKKLISRDRFDEITKNLHVIITSNLSQTEIAAKVRADAFWQVGPFTDILNRNFCHYWRSNQNNSVDEASIPFKGRHRARVYNPNKPEKWHFKAYCLNDADTCYLLCFTLYRGKDEVRPPEHSATAWAVLKLVKDLDTLLDQQTNAQESFSFCNNVIYTDNWYTSMELAHALLVQGTYLCGTIKSNRKNIPKHGIFPKTGRNVKVRGSMQRYHIKVGDDSIQFIAWMDNKPVHLLTTLPTVYRSTVRRNVKENLRWVQKDIAIPTTVQAYNKNMGGTDLNDQYNSYYRSNLKTKKWPPRIYSHFLMVSVTNARVLYMNDNDIPRNNYPLIKFMDSLLNSILALTDAPVSESEDEGTSLPKKRRSEASHLGYSNRLKGHSHTPVAVGDERRICPVCKIRSRLRCKECNVHLHIDGDNENNCWWKYHNEEDFSSNEKIVEV